MLLNHINIPVENVEQSKSFFEKHFDLTCTDVKGDHALAVLKGTDGFTLVLMSNTFNRSDVNGFPSAFHIGFLLPTKEEVTEQYNKLKNSGDVSLPQEPGNMRGVFGFYFTAPGNILVEISSEIR